MCGIAGFLSLHPHQYADSVLTNMTRAIAHRGPDDNGFYRDAQAALGHRRLSIVDLATGHQPMTSESGDLWVVFNGEIFNHATLRETMLEPLGHVYQTHSDTETILHAYEEFGVDSPTHFRGMFAYVIWDRRQRKLFCVRDRLGIKPFYYFWSGREFVFGSEIKALLAHPLLSAALEDSLLPEHLALGYSSGEKTLYRGIHRLMPGHTLTIETQGPDAGKLQIRQYWDVPEPGTPEVHSEAEWLAECHRRLEETVRMRLMSDVPLGMFLSGGVDSSLIAAFMKQMVSGPVKSFAVGYKETEFSELGYAREVAQAIGTQHHEVQIGMDEFFNVLPKLIWHEDEPITWPSSVSLYFVSKLAAEQVKVVLTGEGSDELFGGYGRYHFYLLNQKFLGAWKLLPAGLRKKLRGQVAESPLLSASVRRKLSHTFVGLGDDLESLYLDNFYAAFPAPERAALGQGGDAYANYRHYFEAGSKRSGLDRLLYADQKTYLAELLMKQDQMSMATSIESRVPFLDHTFVEFAARVPQQYKLHGSTGKYLIKKVAEKLIPHSAIYRKKMGFPTPLRVWLQDVRMQPALDAMLTRDGFLASVVDTNAVAAVLQRHRSGQLDATDRLWRLLNLHLWGEMQIAGRRSPEDALLGVTAAA
jgi:asparagine synthase (glutamine-hydrolysing)